MNRPLSPLAWLGLPLLAVLLFAAERTYGMMEHHFIYFPDTRLVATPESLGLDFEEARFTTADGVSLHGWYLPGEPGRPLVLFFHGNAGNISHRVDNLWRLHKLGLPVFIFDYRGYGSSGGRASERGLYEDGRAALSWLEKRGWKPQRMVYFGRSLGAAVALQLALEEPPAGVVLESPFPSIRAMGRHHYPVLFLLLGWMIEARFDNLQKIDRLEAPLLLIQGEEDHIVPVSMARQLFERATPSKTFHLVSGAGHNDTYDRGGKAYWEAWRRFLASLETPTEKATSP